MLRVGLTGGLGSGKSTAGRLFAAHGAHVLEADEIGRELMQPGQAVYAAIVAHFGQGVVAADGGLDRRRFGADCVCGGTRRGAECDRASGGDCAAGGVERRRSSRGIRVRW